MTEKIDPRIDIQASKLKERGNPVNPTVLSLTIKLASDISEKTGASLPIKKIKYLLQSADETSFISRTSRLGKRFKQDLNPLRAP